MSRRKPIVVEVEPTVIKWLFDNSGWSHAELAKRLGTSEEVVTKIINGKKNPTFRQLQELALVFKRPVASFLLSKPKIEKPKPKDYRMIPERTNRFDKKTLLVLRKVRRLQELSKELSGNIGYETKNKLEKVSFSDDPEIVALKYREFFELTEEKQKGFKTSYELFHFIRNFLEDLNIFVFQFSMPVEDARGFVLVDDAPNIIVVNTKDTIEARLFSLMHEFAHILFGESAIDLPDATSETRNELEQWCNLFSAAFLFPSDIAKLVFEKHKESLTDTGSLNYLSKKFKVSKAMLTLKMYNMKFITKSEYNSVLERYKPKPANAKEKALKKKQGGAVPADKKALSEVGNKFVSLVANNYDREYITYTDALNFLSIKSRNFDKVLARAKK